MNDLKKGYEIVVIGKIQLRTTDALPSQGVLVRNREAIEAIWQESQKEKGGKLFNGTIANLVKVEAKGDIIELMSHFIEYKHFLAQIKKPALKLGLKPIGVSGIIILKDKSDEYVIFAKRADNVTEYPCFLELAPSGSIDQGCVQADGSVDYQSQILSEFIEETGFSKEYIKGISGFVLVLDKAHQVYDIGCRILLEGKKERISQDFSSTEYGAPVFVPMDDLGDFIKMNSASIVPTSMALIEAYRQNFKQES